VISREASFDEQFLDVPIGKRVYKTWYLFGPLHGSTAAGIAHLFEQVRLADGVWLADRIEIKANAKILFVRTTQCTS
jgi:hypothetical protein